MTLTLTLSKNLFSRCLTVQVLLLSNAKVGENLKIKCEAKVPYSVVFKWEVNGVKSVKGDERTKVEFSSHESILTIRKATIDDSGFYKCIAR